MLGADPLSFSIAFAAGFVSFASPCVLPLVPGYLALVSGMGLDEAAPRRSAIMPSTAAFVAGFAVMFALLGAGAGFAGGALLEHRRPLEIAGGILVIGMGLVLLGRRVPMFLMRERRVHVSRRPTTLAGSGLVGIAFAVGWSPCIGPTLAAALTLAAASGAPLLGAALLVVYAAGLGLPFLLAAFLLGGSGSALAFLRRHIRAINTGGAALLVVFGVLLATGRLAEITARLAVVGAPL